MPLALKDGKTEIWVVQFDEPRIVHCFDGDFESGLQVEVDLNTQLVTGYGDGNKLPTGKFLRKALTIVDENLDYLVKEWDRMNPGFSL